ncbi:hypothetical protein QTP88_016925 [Uroleucon formosanum]
MPRPKPKAYDRLNNFVKEFGETIFLADNSVLFCKICDIKVSSEKRFTVIQHIKTSKHIQGLNRLQLKSTKTQQLVSTSFSKKNDFNRDSCKAMLSANIPLYKLENKHFREFFELYTKKEIPKEATLRKGYVDDLFVETIEKIKKCVDGKKIWVSIDETTDAEGRFIANVIIGTLTIDEPGSIFLLNSEKLEKSNHSTIFKLFDQSLNLLWPQGVKYNEVLLFVTDAAPYMIKAGKAIQNVYTKIIHVTCLAHGLHRVAEEIRNQYKNVDQLVSNVKKTFLKAPSRIQTLKSVASDIPLPPQLILTRWGTWIDAALYYCKHFEIIKQVIDMLDENDAESIKKCKQILKSNNLEANLAFIMSNYGFISTSITRLETKGMSLTESIKIIKTAKESIHSANVGGCAQAKAIDEKFQKVMEKNVGFVQLQKISDIINGQNESMDVLPTDISSGDIPFFKFAPISSVDVERSFSKYKNILADNRRSFEFSNLKKYLIVQCNAQGNEVPSPNQGRITQ